VMRRADDEKKSLNLWITPANPLRVALSEPLPKPRSVLRRP
jgi:hypothetical protein